MNLPVRTRLTAIYCAVFCLGGAALEAGAYVALRFAVFAIVDRELEARVAGVEAFLAEHLPRMSPARVQNEIRTHTALQPGLLRIGNPNGPAVWESALLARYALERRRSSPRLFTAGTTEQPLRLLAVRWTVGGVGYPLLLATDLTVPFHVVRRFGLLLLLTWPVLMTLAATAGHWTAGRALAPVLAMTKAARHIDATDLSRRLEVPESRDELRYLAETLNGMLARIESAFRKTIEFTANASHELRTPLAVIRATAEVALMRSEALREPGEAPNAPNPDQAALRQILFEAERNTALLENLLRLARADSGTARLHMRLVNAAEILRLTGQRCEPLAAKHGIHLRVELPAEAPWLTADTEYLRSLFLIPLDNALKYTARGGFVEAALLTDGSGHLIYRVKDTGIGISESDLPHIFERFYRSDRVRNREEGGAGLGLAIAEWMAHVHAGWIEVESRLGAGSTFRIVLPLRAPSALPEPAAPIPSVEGRHT